MKRTYDRNTLQTDVISDIGYQPGKLGQNPLSASQRTALKYYCRRWLGLSRDQVQGSLDVMRQAYDKLQATTTSDNSTVTVEPDSDDESDNAANDLAKIIKRLAGNQPLDEKAIREIARSEATRVAQERDVTVRVVLESREPKPTVTLPDAPRHKVFTQVLTAVDANCNVLLVGPAGSGKTYLAEQVAQTLGLSFRFSGAVASEYKLLGFVDAQGRTVRTPYRETYEHGGVFLWDELDGSSPNALLAFNAGLSNGHQDFPDNCVVRHENTRMIASANTYGHGADRMYVGRNQLDAASLDRFVTIAMGYDEILERRLYGDGLWTLHVQKVRAAVEKLKIRHVVSMRAIDQGLRLLERELDWSVVEKMTVYRGLDHDSITKIQAEVT